MLSILRFSVKFAEFPHITRKEKRSRTHYLCMTIYQKAMAGNAEGLSACRRQNMPFADGKNSAGQLLPLQSGAERVS